MIKNTESSSQSSAPGDPTKESFFQRLDISSSISESSNTSNPASISTSMRKKKFIFIKFFEKSQTHGNSNKKR